MSLCSIGNLSQYSSNCNTVSSCSGMIDCSKLTGSTPLSASDTTTLSNMFGDDYGEYQQMLGSCGASGSCGESSGVSTVAKGVSGTEAGGFDFGNYLGTYFPNLSEEEIASLTSFYNDQAAQMFDVMHGNCGSMCSDGCGGIDTDSILSSARSAASGNTSFNISDYLNQHFPNLSNQQVGQLSNMYEEQYADMPRFSMC